jgi:hypothetical protein
MLRAAGPLLISREDVLKRRDGAQRFTGTVGFKASAWRERQLAAWPIA